VHTLRTSLTLSSKLSSSFVRGDAETEVEVFCNWFPHVQIAFAGLGQIYNIALFVKRVLAAKCRGDTMFSM